jgi:AcrR family transcriptional regulator
MVAALRSHTPKGRRACTRILDATESLFAARGFYGTSMRDAAAAAQVPLATVVYHFARKEQLYAALLDRIAEELMAELDQVEDAPPSERVGVFARVVVRWTTQHPGRVRLVVRELLDNPTRIARASRLPLATFLERAALLVAPRRRAPELAVLHVIGGISYATVAWPTLRRIVGSSRTRELAASHEREAIAFARHALPQHSLVTSRWSGAARARSRRRDEGLPRVIRGAATKSSRELPPRGGAARASSGVAQDRRR